MTRSSSTDRFLIGEKPFHDLLDFLHEHVGLAMIQKLRGSGIIGYTSPDRASENPVAAIYKDSAPTVLRMASDCCVRI